MLFFAIQNIIKKVLAIILYVVASHVVWAFPLATLDNPCMTYPNVSPKLPTTKALLKSAVTTTNAAMASSQTLMEKIKTDGLLASSEFDAMINFKRPLPGLPYRQEATTISAGGMASTLKQHYNDTSTHILFLQTSIEDQVKYDNGKYKNELQMVQSYFYACLCKVNMLVKSLKDDVTQYLDSSVVPYYLKNMSDDKRRYKRNLIMINQGKRLLNAQNANYDKMIEVTSAVG